MNPSSLSPAARILVNPWDAERVRLQEAVIEAALAWHATYGDARMDCSVVVSDACFALLRYTAPKHHAQAPPKKPPPARRRREDRVLPKKAASR